MKILQMTQSHKILIWILDLLKLRAIQLQSFSSGHLGPSSEKYMLICKHK